MINNNNGGSDNNNDTRHKSLTTTKERQQQKGKYGVDYVCLEALAGGGPLLEGVPTMVSTSTDSSS